MEYTWDDLYQRADGAACGEDVLKAKDEARWQVRNFAMEHGEIDPETAECPEDLVSAYCEKHVIRFDEHGNIIATNNSNKHGFVQENRNRVNNVVQREETETDLHICTGHYMNYYNEHGMDLFIIINEGNGEATTSLDVEKLYKAEEICEKYVENEPIDKSALQYELERVFEYGVQIYLVSDFK